LIFSKKFTEEDPEGAEKAKQRETVSTFAAPENQHPHSKGEPHGRNWRQPNAVDGSGRCCHTEDSKVRQKTDRTFGSNGEECGADSQKRRAPMSCPTHRAAFPAHWLNEIIEHGSTPTRASSVVSGSQ